MTDAQTIAVSGSFVVASLAVLTGVLLNNTRLNDVKELLRAEIKTSKANTQAQIAELRVIVEKQHSELLLKISEFENRRVITRFLPGNFAPISTSKLTVRY